MDPIVLFLKKDILPEDKSEANKVRRRRLISGYPRTISCTSAHFLGHTYFAFTLRHQSYSLRSYMKGFMEAMQEADHCLTKLSLMAIGGQICRKKRKST